MLISSEVGSIRGRIDRPQVPIKLNYHQLVLEQIKANNNLLPHVLELKAPLLIPSQSTTNLIVCGFRGVINKLVPFPLL